MCHEEAASDSPHRRAGKRYGTVRRMMRSYFLIVLVLTVLIMVLCANYYKIYRSYIDTSERFETAVGRYESVLSDKNSLSLETQSLKTENEGLKSRCAEISEQNAKIAEQNNELVKCMEELKKKNAELVKKNKELAEDNVALQNSIKTAASAGIKPQNYKNFEGISSRGDVVRGTYLGKFLGTAYTPSTDECGNAKGITNSGMPVIPGISVAIDNRYWPFGTVFYIKGLGYAVAMDTGSAIKGKYRFDFAVFDKKFANALGKKYWQVYLVKLGKGYVEDIKF